MHAMAIKFILVYMLTSLQLILDQISSTKKTQPKHFLKYVSIENICMHVLVNT